MHCVIKFLINRDTSESLFVRKLWKMTAMVNTRGEGKKKAKEQIVKDKSKAAPKKANTSSM